MATTTNLGLVVDQAGSTKFRSATAATDTYVKNIDENMRKIDQFAGEIKGVGGTITLLASSWSGTTYTLTVVGLGTNDAIFFSPSTTTDKEALEANKVFISPSTSGTTVTITAETAPSTDISLDYFISRG